MLAAIAATMESLGQLEAMAEQLYTAQNPDERAAAEQALAQFASNPQMIPQCQVCPPAHSRSCPCRRALRCAPLLRRSRGQQLAYRVRCIRIALAKRGARPLSRRSYLVQWQTARGDIFTCAAARRALKQTPAMRRCWCAASREWRARFDRQMSSICDSLYADLVACVYPRVPLPAIYC